MTGPFSGWVLAGGLVISSPALKAAFVDGTMPLETALVRLGVALAAAWLGVFLLAALVGRAPEPEPDAGPDAPTTEIATVTAPVAAPAPSPAEPPSV